MRAHLTFHRGKLALGQPEFLLFLPAGSPDFIPALLVAFAVAFNIFGQGMQRKVRGCEGQVMKERFIGMLLGMFLQDRNSMISDGISDIKLGTDGGSWLSFIIEIMEFQAEEAVVINVIGTVKASGQGQSVNMPFTGMIGPVT